MGVNSQSGIILQILGRKLHENEKNWISREVDVSLALPWIRHCFRNAFLFFFLNSKEFLYFILLNAACESPVLFYNSTEYCRNNKMFCHNCCDIGQIDIFSRIELFPLSSCQVIILIARMTFNCSTSCLMS